MWPASQDPRPWLQWYPPGVPAALEIASVPVTKLLDDAAARRPRHTAYIFYGRRISYRQFQRAVDRFAGGLRDIGVLPGDRVALILPNCPQQAIAFFGVLRIGAVTVQHNPLSTEEEMRHQLADCGARVAVVLDRSYATLRAVRRTVLLDHVVVTSLIDYLPLSQRLALRLPLVQAQRRRARITAKVPADRGLFTFRELMDGAPSYARQAPIDPAKHLAAIQYTGGTEGRPKGVMLTHRNLVANAGQQQAWDVGCRDGGEITLGVLPQFHSFGLTSCLVAPVLRAGTVVLLPRFDRAQTVKAIRRYRPTIFPGVPTLYDQVLDGPELGERDLDSVRIFLSGANALGADTIARFGRLGIGRGRLVQAYGLTEASPAVTCNPLSRSARNDTVGVPIPLTDVVVVDEDEPTRPVPPGQPGVLVLRGPQVFAGYWNQPLATAQALSKGWLRTGDIAVMSRDGFVTILERQQDMIKVSGFSVFPSEVEDVLRRHPAVIDCAVVGLPDERRGEKVVAFVVEHPAYPFSADELRRHCEKSLSHYKVPREFRPRADLPRSAIGKVVRRILREEYPRAPAG